MPFSFKNGLLAITFPISFDVLTRTGVSNPKGLEDCFADTFREGCGIFRRGLKNYVSTLDIGLHVPKAETLAESAKNVHLDCVVSADVDSSQHRDVGGHTLYVIEML